MDKVKLTIAAFALVLTAGATMAFQKSNATTQTAAPNCSSQKFSNVLDVTSPDDCLGDAVTCCYIPGTDTEFDRIDQ